VNTGRSGDLRALDTTKEPLMIRVIRALVPSLLLPCLAACELTTDTIARSAASCDEVLPGFTQWNGQPLPPPATESNAMFFCHPVPSQALAIAVDSGKIAAAVALPADQLGAFIAAQLQVNPMPDGPPTMGDPPHYAHFITAGKGTTCPPTGKGITALFEDATDAMAAAYNQAIADYQSGKICPLPPPPK
jgi:hypothetical protein